VKFYSTDNFQQMDVVTGGGFGKPQDTGRITQSLIAAAADSQTWFAYHQKNDRFSVKVSTLLRPRYSETYFFSVAAGLVKNSDERKSGVELWVDGFLVIADDGSTQGQL